MRWNVLSLTVTLAVAGIATSANAQNGKPLQTEVFARDQANTIVQMSKEEMVETRGSSLLALLDRYDIIGLDVNEEGKVVGTVKLPIRKETLRELGIKKYPSEI
jgi:hypothetical protein